MVNDSVVNIMLMNETEDKEMIKGDKYYPIQYFINFRVCYNILTLS